MSARSASASPFEIDVAPALKLYMDGLESWKENCERLLQPVATSPAADKAGSSPPAGRTVPEWPIPSGWLQQIAWQQNELWSFYGRRMECYIELSDRIARCRTPADLGEAQLEFIRQTIADYSRQGTKAMQAAPAAQPAI